MSLYNDQVPSSLDKHQAVEGIGVSELLGTSLGVKADTYRLCLPEGVDHRTSALTNGLVVPVPRLWVDWLSDTTQDPQSGEIIPGGEGRKHFFQVCCQ